MSSESDHHATGSKEKAQTFFRYGNDAALKANYDYAIQMYREACKLDPGNLIFRQALRGTERRKFGNEPAKVGRLVGARNQPIRMRARSAHAKGHWGHALEVCEEAFVNNPWDVGAAREGAESAEAMGLKELAQWFLESVQTVAADADFFRHLARVHLLNNAYPKAIAAWERVKKISPNDEDANRQINAISASATIHRSGLNESLTKRAAEAEEAPSGSRVGASPAGLDDLKAVKVSPEDRWTKEIQEDPTMVGPYLQFASHLKTRGKLDDAEKLLTRGLKAVPDDPALKQMHAEVQILRIQRAIDSWAQKLRDRPDDAEARAKHDQLQTMLVDYEAEEFRRRIKLHPGDLDLHYQLGVRLARGGKHRDAIAAFQQARASAPLRVKALLQTGLSFEAENALKLAERSYQDALKSADTEDVSTLNELHYRLGRVSEAMGNTKAAEEHYNEVAANDYGYLDVAQRLRSLN